MPRRIAKEFEEEGLGEDVELGEGVAALGPQRLSLIQDRRNPPLFRQQRERDFDSRDNCFRHFLEGCAVAQAFEIGAVLSQPVEQEFCIQLATSGTKLLKPWFVATGTRFTATWPMGARELNKTDPTGSTSAAQL